MSGLPDDPLHEEAAAGVVPSRATRAAAALGVRGGGGALRSFATYLPTHVVSAAAGLVVLPVLARKLPPTELGVLALAQTAVTFGWIVAGNWLVSALFRELPAHREGSSVEQFSRTLVRALAVTIALLGIFVVLLTAAARESAAIGDNLPLIAAATAGLVLQNVAASLFAAAVRPRAYAIVDVLGRSGGIALGTVFVYRDHGVGGYLSGLAIASGVAGLAGLAAAWPRGVPADSTPHPRARVTVTPWLRYGLPATVAAVAAWGFSYVDRYMLAALENAGAVGVYSVGSAIGEKAVTIPALAFFFASRPILVATYERDGRGAVERLLEAHTRILLVVGVPTVLAVALTAEDVVSLLTGPRALSFSDAGAIAPIISLGALLYALGILATTGLVVERRMLPIAGCAAAGLATNTLANFALIPAFSVRGAAVASVLGAAVYVSAAAAVSRRYVRWFVPRVTMRRVALAAVAATAAALAVPSLETRTANVLADGGVVLGVYLSVLALLHERLRVPTMPS